MAGDGAGGVSAVVSPLGAHTIPAHDAAGLDAACAHQAAVVRANPAEVIERKRLATLEFMRGHYHAALAQLATALMLPVDPAHIHQVAVDLAIVMPALIGMGQGHVLRSDFLRRALVAQPDVARAVYDCILDRLTTGNDLHLDAEDVRGVIDYFAGLGLGATGPLAEASLFHRFEERHVVSALWMDVLAPAGERLAVASPDAALDPHRLIPLGHFMRMVDELSDSVDVDALWLGLHADPLDHPNLGEMVAYPAERGLTWPVHVVTRATSLTAAGLHRLLHHHPAALVVGVDGPPEGQPAHGLVALLAALVAAGSVCRLRLDLDLSDGQPARPLLRRWLDWAQTVAAGTTGVLAVRHDDNALDAALAEALTGGGELALWWWPGRDGPPGMASLAPLLPDRASVRPAVAASRCGYGASPSLAVHASGRLGLCPLDPAAEAWFAEIDSFARLDHALFSRGATRLLAELGNGVASRAVCRRCPQMRERYP